MTRTRTLKSTTDARIRLEHGAFDVDALDGTHAVNDTITIDLPNGFNLRIAVITSDICGKRSTFGTIFTHGSDNAVVDYVPFRDCEKE